MMSMDMEREAQRTLQRLLPRLEKELSDRILADAQGMTGYLYQHEIRIFDFTL
jgi:hypothetical protein